MKIFSLVIVFSVSLLRIGFAQQIYNIRSFAYSHMAINQPQNLPQGRYYYENEHIQQSEGIISIYKNKFIIKLLYSHNQLNYEGDILKIEKASDRTTYYTSDSQLIILESIVTNGVKFQDVQYNFDYNSTIKIYKKLLHFETISEATTDDLASYKKQENEHERQREEREDRNAEKKINNGLVFEQKEISNCARFIGSTEDLWRFYQKTNAVYFPVFIIIDESGKVNYDFTSDQAKNYIPDTTELNKILKFTPAIKTIRGKPHKVKSSRVLFFAHKGISDVQNGEAKIIIKKSGDGVAVRSVTQKYTMNDADDITPVTKTVDKKEIIKDIDFFKILKEEPNGIYEVEVTLKFIKAMIEGIVVDDCDSDSLKRDITKPTIRYRLKGDDEWLIK